MEIEAWEIKSEEFPKDGVLNEKLRFLIRYAMLAPSSHNTQPWKFFIKDDEILVYVDFNRWLKIADSDKRELYISVGCAIENLLIAAKYFKFSTKINYFPQGKDSELISSIKLKEQDYNPSEDEISLFNAILKRHTNHNIFEEKQINEENVEQLRSIKTDDNIEIFITNDLKIKQKVDELITEADIAQFSDPEYRNELAYWIGEGVFGTPWLISKIAKIIYTYIDRGEKIAAKDEEILLSASHLAVIASKDNSRLSQVKSGQLYERLALKASTKDIRTHPMSNILELPKFKKEVKNLIPEKGLIPQHTFRLGYAEVDKHSPRRNLDEILLKKPF